mmetsp:Transcript_83141/g.235859  ORF Transcript_83141/g.235859 Transcript_83141/m.235859 type:complete len:96 (-) Transcript_83141:238-525(-)
MPDTTPDFGTFTMVPLPFSQHWLGPAETGRRPASRSHVQAWHLDAFWHRLQHIPGVLTWSIVLLQLLSTKKSMSNMVSPHCIVWPVRLRVRHLEL